MRKLQHTLIFAGLVAACLMAGCKKENPSQGTSFTAETEQDEANAKTELVDSDIRWKSGDQIWLKNSNNQTEQLTVAEGIGTNKGKFYTSSSFNLNPPYTATYGVNISNGAVSLPSTQTLTAAQVTSTQSNPQGTIADGLMPMVATSSTNKLPFKNLLGGLCFKLTGSGALTAIRITSNTSEKLWGDFTANFADGTMAPKPNGAGSNVLTVNCTSITLTSTVQYFIVMLPPGTLASGYTVEFLNGNTVNHSVNATGSATLVQRSKIKTSNQTVNIVPVVTYTVTTSVNNASWGTVSGGGTYQQNATCTVTATPASGYILESWTMNGLDVTWNRSYSLTVNSNVTLTANFVQVPTDALPGLFLVAGSMNNSPRRVWFSKGNVQYNNGSTWRFATNQYDRIGDNGQYTQVNNASGVGYGYTGARDVFSWAMNGQLHRSQTYPWYMPYHDGLFANSYYPNACFAYAEGASGNYGYDLNALTGMADWGYNFGSGWRTPTSDEWSKLISNHTSQWSLVNDVPGYVIRPYGNTDAIASSYSATSWATEEAKGSLFLPAAGIRDYNGNGWIGSGTSGFQLPGVSPQMTNFDKYGYYWSATHSDDPWYNAYYMYFNNSSIAVGTTLRNHGCCVRLIKNR